MDIIVWTITSILIGIISGIVGGYIAFWLIDKGWIKL